jgi:hypothetical protein
MGRPADLYCLVEICVAGWMILHRTGVVETLATAVGEGDLRADMNLEAATDLLYRPISTC